MTAGDAVVTQGLGAGRTLDEVVEEDPEGRSGALGMAAASGKPIFPLLVKLIDASENLSIQVHPDDEAAVSLQKLGKTEAWYVLDAVPGAGLYVGLAEDTSIEKFRASAALLDGTSSRLMRFAPASTGQTLLIPAGTIHALGAGVIVYEIQQPSDVTYRLDDWGRVDAAGNPREMHLEPGFAVARPELRPGFIDPVEIRTPDASLSLLVACRYFALARLNLAAAGRHHVGWPHSAAVVTLLAGDAHLGDQSLAAGQSGVVWAGSGAELVAESEVTALIAWVPDLDRDIVQPARTAGATAEEIQSLAGDTHDIATDRVAP